jgi:DNA ligase-1
MRQFAALFETLDQTTKTNKKVEALVHYLTQASNEDKMWAIALLTGKRPKRTVRTNLLREWAAEEAGIPLWLFENSYHVVGDLAETIALLVNKTKPSIESGLADWMKKVQKLGQMEDAQKKATVLSYWRGLDVTERFVFNKLIGGSFRVGVSQKLMVRAVAKYTGLEENEIALKLMGNWNPIDYSFNDLILSQSVDVDISRPYPFFLAYQVEDVESLDVNTEEWFVERKWDGIRGQLVKRSGEIFVWSRGEELVTDKYPEFKMVAPKIPDGMVLDGEILPFKDNSPLPFQQLQKRIGRKNISKKILVDVPVVLVAYDLLEWQGEDIRNEPLSERRKRLEQLVERLDSQTVRLSPLVSFNGMKELSQERDNSRKHKSEGLMLKRRDSIYQVGRKKGGWWKWKIDPMVIDAVLIYAMRGHGRRANLYTDYTFAVWDEEGNLIPFTKAYSGLTDSEIRQVDRFIRQNTLDRFGPVRSVKPELVFELAFEGINRSSRHKSGIALRFPRMNRWRTDKKPQEANTLSDLQDFLAEE